MIVIVGLPRSGTSWLAKIFDSHPATFYCHEPDSRGGLRGVPFAPDCEEAATYSPAIRQFAASLPSTREVRVIGKLPVFPKSYDLPGGYPLRRATVVVGKLLGKVVADPKVRLPVKKGAAMTVLWKSIESTARLGTLARALPDARFVHLIRHPCGYVDSVVRGYESHRFSSSTPPWGDAGIIGLLSETREAQRYAASRGMPASPTNYERLAWLWLVQNEKALDETQHLANVTAVRYEELCAHPVDACRRLFATLGLTWATETQRFIEASTSSHHSSYYALSKDPLRAAHEWRRRLSADAARGIQQLVSGTAIWTWYDSAKAEETQNEASGTS
jgi:hypothetical protein